MLKINKEFSLVGYVLAHVMLQWRFSTAAMSHGRNDRFFFLWEQMLFLMQNIFIVPAMKKRLPCKTSIESLSKDNGDGNENITNLHI